MYRATRFSGNLPKFLQIECSEPFSQYLDWVSMGQRGRVSDGVLENDVQGFSRLDKAIVLDNVRVIKILEQINFHLHIRVSTCG